MQTKEFLKDIGLDLGLKEIADQVKAERKPLTFIGPYPSVMDNPYAAVQIHIQNLILTYGKDMVVDAVTYAATK